MIALAIRILPPPNPMPYLAHRKCLGRCLGLLTAIFVLAVSISAQTTTPRAPITTATAPAGPVLTLDPFQVKADSDRGFIATSSLAGGRMAGDLKDTPVAYTVLTREFIDALQLTDLTSMSQWSTNATDLADDNQQFNTGNSVRISSRGVSSNSPQRNFFPVNYDFDSYNIERLDLARGPNAILFGNSGVGGTTNSVTKQARTERTFSEIRASAGSWDNYRYTIDHNQPLTDKLAFRVNALFDDRKGWRDNDGQTRQGVTLAGTWKPFRNTEIRVEAERGEMDRAVVSTVFEDNLSGWNGTSTFSAPIVTAPAGTGISRQAVRKNVFTPSSGNVLTNYEGWAITQGGNQAAATPAGGVLVVGTTANITNESITEQLNLPANLYDLVVANSNFEIPDRTMSTYPSNKIFGVENREYTVSLTQRIGDDLFVEIAANKGSEYTNSDIGISRSMGKVYLDVNSKLPNGSNNPNYLEPFVETISFPYLQYRDKTNLRLAVGYVRNQTKWGDFAFNLIAGQSTNDFDRNAFRYNLKTNPDPRQWPSFEPVTFRYYLNTDDGRPLLMPDSWTLINPVTGITSTVPAGRVRDYSNTSFNQVNKTNYDYIQVSGKAKLFKQRVHLLAAARRDQYTTHQDSIVLQFDNPTDWDGYKRIFKPAAPADWNTLTYRERDTAGNPFGSALPADTRPRVSNLRDTRYANDRFRDDYAPPDAKDSVDTFSVGSVVHVTKHISVFGNYAESFQPPSVALKIDGTIFQPVAAQGQDYGVRFTFLDGDIVANVIRYTGEEVNRSQSSTPFQQNFNSLIRANKLGDLISDLNSRGLLPLPAGYVDSVSRQIEGWEFELTANFTKSWRLTANAAMPEANQSNANGESIAYFNKNKATLRLIVEDAGGTFNGDVATYTGTPPPGQSSSEGQAAVTAWNNNISAFAALSDGQKLTRLTELTGNIFTDYTFRAEKLKGFRVGGGVNYRGRQVIGTRGGDTIRNPAAPNQAIDDPSVGPYDYVYSKPYAVGTLTFNYTKRLNKKYTVSFDLKIDNLFDYDQPLYFNTLQRPVGGDLTNPGRVATPGRFSWVTPRNFMFSTRLKF